VLVPGFNNAPANQLGDGVDANDRPFLPYFPYVALPHNPLSNVNDVEQKGGALSSPAEFSDPRTVTRAETGAKLALGSANPGANHVLAYSLPQAARVTLKVYAANGRLVRTLVDQDAAAGTFRATWDGRDDGGAAVARGVYFARYATDGAAADDRKLILQ
jgi:hypothetical protein